MSDKEPPIIEAEYTVKDGQRTTTPRKETASETFAYVIVSIFAAIIGGFIMSITARAVDTLDPIDIGLVIVFMTILFIWSFAMTRDR